MILGKHTLDETRDLLAIADNDFKSTGEAFNAMNPKPMDIATDWATLSATWAVDRKQIANMLIEAAIKGFPMPSSVIPTEDIYSKILNYIQYQENVHGSLQDITHRIEVATGKQILPYRPGQGQSTVDVDTELFQQLDATTQRLDAAAEQAKEEAKKAATSNTGLLIGGAVLATLIGVGAAKHYL